jgi:hypothetical protein
MEEGIMEKILKELGSTNPFDENGELTSNGADAYDKLIKIIAELHRIGVITETVDSCEKCFDEIFRLGF